jgi:hypothetical protein
MLETSRRWIERATKSRPVMVAFAVPIIRKKFCHAAGSLLLGMGYGHGSEASSAIPDAQTPRGEAVTMPG